MPSRWKWVDICWQKRRKRERSPGVGVTAIGTRSAFIRFDLWPVLFAFFSYFSFIWYELKLNSHVADPRPIDSVSIWRSSSAAARVQVADTALNTRRGRGGWWRLEYTVLRLEKNETLGRTSFSPLIHRFITISAVLICWPGSDDGDTAAHTSRPLC